MSDTVGVVGLQGDVPQHIAALETAVADDVEVTQIRSAGTVPDCSLVVLPGGESTTISRLLTDTGIDDELVDHVDAEKPLLATCAGLIIAANDVQDERVATLDLLDASVDRNAFGRQRESFEADVTVEGLAEPYRGVFIRAPRISDAGTCDVVARLDEEPVAIRDGPVVGASFHLELAADPRFYSSVFEVVGEGGFSRWRSST